MKDFSFDLNAIDHKTKFILAHLLVERRTRSEVIKFLKPIKINCYQQILKRYTNPVL